jgi:hypothetical protein
VEAEIGRITVGGHPKQKVLERAGGVVQVVKHLLSKCTALSSNPRTKKKKFFEFNLNRWKLGGHPGAHLSS